MSDKCKFCGAECEDDTPPIDERLAAAGKIFRELVKEREELRREVKRLRAEIAEANQ